MSISKVVDIIRNKGYEAELQEIVKGSSTRTAIVMGDGTVRPTIYPDSFTGTDEEIADKIIEVFEKTQVPEFDIYKLTDAERIKQNAFVAVRRPMDDGAFVKEYLDIQLVIRVEVYTKPEETASYILHKDLAEKLNYDETIFDEAIKNMNFEFKPLGAVVGNFLETNEIPDCGMYVVSTESRHFGGSAIYDTQLLKSIADLLNSDLVIIPSSTQELIVMRKGADTSIEDLDAMVKEINMTQVSLEEQLADHVYVFNRADNSISY